MAVKMHVLSCKSSVAQEVKDFQTVVNVLPAATKEEMLRIQGRLVILSEPDEVTASQA